MDTKELERRLADLRTRLAKLPPPAQEQALDGFADVLTVLETQADKNEPAKLLVSLDRKSNIEYPSG
jgi:uncharacterized coiled-coil protein SlyX